MADQVGSLLALTAGGLRGATPANAQATRSLYENIHDCLVQRCTEPQLTAADVAASMNISVRTLHRIFAAANETFGVWREGQHDDLVLAVALACWWAERCPPLGNVNDLNWSRARKARGAVIDIVT